MLGYRELNIPTGLRTLKTPMTLLELNVAILSRAVLGPSKYN